VSHDDAVLDPTNEGGLMDSEMCCRFLFRQHTPLSKAVVARAEPVTVDQIGDPQCGEASLGLPVSRRSAGANSTLVEKAGYFLIDVVVE
jgi:hypothetical protein